MLGDAKVVEGSRARCASGGRSRLRQRIHPRFGWTPRGDTLINVGAGIVQVDLRRPSTLTRKADAGRCDRKDWSALVEESRKQGKRVDPDRIQKRCGRMSTRRCLDPPLAGVEIILRYVDPLGNVTYRTVVTDADGCYEDFLVSTTGGTCQVTAEYPSSKCEAPAVGGPITVCWCHD